MQVNELAPIIYEELGSPSGISVAYISGWLVNNSSRLNFTLGVLFSGISGQIMPEPLQEECQILKMMFFSSYYQRQINSVLDAASYDSWVEITDDNSTVRRVSKSELSKIYAGQKSNADNQLRDLIYAYNLNSSRPASICQSGLATSIVGYAY